ncbi:hypothetical protein EXE25_17625 [Acinetobacter bouvetii]|uniref:Uncharacterized protein n=1 Tax=Acinetobacter bouvetii TaxID=202951 RepID=A0A4Q7AQ54_9GAMM|nr:hypothetical protein [Acinetobacter bouvetii]RZG64153.1 hypothetical protein EXE25_17625 [Acinetobacter bouvetii]
MNTAEVIPFRKPQVSKQEAKNMYSDKFAQGYVMSSRLYRKEVWPFLSDAARNVYAELENRINGHNKESDFVSYSQLQGGELEGSRKLSRETVRNGIDELLKLNVVSISGTGARGVKKYLLNEISIKDQFANKTSSTTEPVRKVNQTSSASELVTGSETEHTIDNSIDSLENKKNTVPVDNSKSEMFGDSVKYHEDNKNLYSLRELSKVYPVQSDLVDQIVDRCPDLTNDQIMSELKNFAQWSTSREKTTAQGWMNYWLYRIQKLSAPKAKSSKAAKAKSKGLSDAQIDYFAAKLTNFHEFAGMYSNVGETQKAFTARVASKLRDPEQLKHWASYLKDVGFTGTIEDFT